MHVRHPPACLLDPTLSVSICCCPCSVSSIEWFAEEATSFYNHANLQPGCCCCLQRVQHRVVCGGGQAHVRRRGGVARPPPPLHGASWCVVGAYA